MNNSPLQFKSIHRHPPRARLIASAMLTLLLSYSTEISGQTTLPSINHSLLLTGIFTEGKSRVDDPIVASSESGNSRRVNNNTNISAEASKTVSRKATRSTNNQEDQTPNSNKGNSFPPAPVNAKTPELEEFGITQYDIAPKNDTLFEPRTSFDSRSKHPKSKKSLSYGSPEIDETSYRPGPLELCICVFAIVCIVMWLKRKKLVATRRTRQRRYSSHRGRRPRSELRHWL